MNLFGLTANGLPIFSYTFGKEGPEILILAGVHGDEPEGVVVAQELLNRFRKSFPYKLQLTLVPILNWDGLLLSERTNGNQVDLNRNLPTKDWTQKFKEARYHPGLHAGSEPENKALLKWLKQHHPKFVITLHSWDPVINVNGDCFPEAKIISDHIKYKIVEDIGYPTPGSLGTYCGLERGVPTITYEVERDSATEDILALHPLALEKALKEMQNRK